LAVEWLDLQPGVTEECLDTDMQDILREAQTRLRDFTDTMTTSGPSVCADRPRPADEVALICCACQ
jgi:hypothetical protein